MTTVKDCKMKDLEKAALQKEIALYSNLLAQHTKLLKAHSAAKNASLSRNPRTSNSTHVKISTSVKSNPPYNSNLKFFSKNLTNAVPQSSSSVPNSSFRNRTVLINKTKSLVSKAPVSVLNKLHVEPFGKKNVLSWTPAQKPSNNYPKSTSISNKSIVNFKKAALSLSSVPESQYQKNLKYHDEATIIERTSMMKKNILKNNEKVRPNKEICQGKSPNPRLLIGEILAITQKLKQTSKTLSSSKISSLPSLNNETLVRVNDTICNQSLKSSAKPIFFSNTTKADIKKVLGVSNTANNTLSAPLHAISTCKLSLDKGRSVQSAAVPDTSIVLNPNFLPLSNVNETHKCLSNGLATEQKVQNLNILKCKLSSSLKKLAENKPIVSNNSQKRLKNVQIVFTTPTRKVAKMFCSSTKKKNAITKLTASKYQVVNKYSPLKRTMTAGLSNNLNNICKSRYKSRKWTSLKEFKQKAIVSNPEQLNSKYKIVNKILDAGDNLKNSDPFKFSPIKNLKSNYTILNKRKAGFEGLNERKASKPRSNCIVFPLNSKSNVVIHKPLTKLYSKNNKIISSANKNYKSPMLLKKRKVNSLNSSAKSKYKVVYKPSTSIVPNIQNKVSKGFKLNSGKLCSFPKTDIDVDLLLELAAEKSKSTDIMKTPIQNKRVLMKRVYKSKNAIINKNISSAQVKTAKMIKSKYFTVNKKHSWQKRAASRRFSRHKQFQGGLNKHFQSRIVAPFYPQKTGRNQFKLRVANYSSSSYILKRNYKRSLYLRNQHNFSSTHGSKCLRFATNRKVVKVNAMKQSTPVSKMLASRVLQHSINRVLTASIKKKMSKVNTYCMFYNRFGRCNKGTKCPYVHDPSKIAICTRFLRGTCKVENCSFSHEICPGKMAICSFFLSGSCTKTNCPYRHEMLSPNSDLCKAFVQGYCPKGKQCKKAHILVCPQYIQGICSKGDECAFPHPPPKEKKISTKTDEKSEFSSDADEFLVEKVSRYFQPLSKEMASDKTKAPTNSVVPKRKNLPEQPSFISLSSSDC